ncbi:MAG: ABC transporter ATP-binding protein [Tropicimonas sp.]|uniref:ABC transporter ATP-binding protein n=1 Tax=Tropicimonas sp. TaxID=2067044 RepID=UPI003A8491B6
MTVITLDNVTKSYGAFQAVTRFDLETRDGEFVVLVGPSGCGKTTTMRMIAGLEEASTGSIRFDGDDVTLDDPKERDVAMVFQNYGLYPHLTVHENMAFCLRVKKWDKARINARIDEVAGALGLSGLLKRKPGELSGGQRQRVALGRAIVRKPRVFLMDEPLSNLDAKLRIAMRGEITRLCRRLKVTTFYVTHDQLEAMTMGERIVVMNNGHVHQIASPQEIYDAPADLFVAGFIGSPPMNILDARAAPDGASVEIEGISLPADPGLRAGLVRHGGEVVKLGLRPEHLSLGDNGLSGEVENIELLGAQVLIQVRVGTALIAAQFDRVPGLALGQEVTLSHLPGTMHAFDPGTEKSLTAGMHGQA